MNRIKFWPNIINNGEGPIPDNSFGYDYNNEELDHSVHGAGTTPDRRELKINWIYSYVNDLEKHQSIYK